MVCLVLDIVLSIILLVCFYTDIKFNKIYNAVLVPAAVVAFAGNIYLGGVQTGITSIKGLILGMGLLFIPFMMGGIGAGDVKLLGVIGIFKGPDFVWTVFLMTALVGGLISIIVMVKSKNFIMRLKTAFMMLLSILRIVPVPVIENIGSETALTFPYGAAITAGTVLAYLLR